MVKIFQCYDTQQLGRMRRYGREQVVQPPHGTSQVGLRQNPPAAKAAEAVDLGQTGSDDELRSELIGSFRSVRVYSVEVDFVDQYTRSHAAGQVPNLEQHGIGSQDTAGIMKVG